MIGRKHAHRFGHMANLMEASLLGFIVIFALSMYDFTIPLFVEDFNASPFIIGLSVSLLYVASFIFETPVGLLVDKYGRKKVLLAGLLGLSLLSLVYFLSQSVIHVMILALFFGVISLAFWIPAGVLVREASTGKSSASAFGVYFTSSQVGQILGPALAGSLAFYFSLRHNFLALSAILFIAMIYAVVFIRKKGRAKLKPGKVKFKTPVGIYKRYFKMHRSAIPLYIVYVVLNMWIGVEWVFIQLAGGNVFHFNEMMIGALLSAMMVMEGIPYIASGYIMDRVGKHWIIMGGFMLLYAATYLGFLSTGPLYFVAFMFLAAASVAWIAPGCEAILTDISPKKEIGEMTAVLDSSKDLGLALGPTIGGALITYSGNYMMPFLMICILSAGSVFVAFMMRPRKDKGKKIRLLDLFEVKGT